jgi:hypothetical protein
MTKGEMNKLKRGDIIRHKHTGESWLVTLGLGNITQIIRTGTATNPEEWEKYCKECGK